MQRRRLGKTDLELPILAFGASSLGQEFRKVSLDEVFESYNLLEPFNRISTALDQIHAQKIGEEKQ